MESLAKTIDSVNNSFVISILPDSAFIDFVKNFKPVIDTITVIYSTLLNIFVLYSLPIFHRGLKFHIHLRFDISTILSYVIPLNGYSKAFAVPITLLPLRIFEIICASIVCGAITNIILERLLATILINFYESWISYTFVIGIGALTGTIFALFTCLMLFFNNGFILVFPLGFALFFGMIVAVLYITHKNTKLFAIRTTSDMSLSQRYQLSENLRLIKILRILLLTEVLCNSCNMSAFFAYFITDNFWVKIFLHYVWQWIGFTFATSVLGIFYMFLSKDTRPKFRRLCQVRRSTKVESRSALSIKTTMGEQMVFQNNQEADVYFKQLASSWN
uniref:Serpentine Receptor, class E (Epsilon) n=1 Tax=Panagrellus redivivus TaxID=6233 RepID=A0A7E4VY59_PANRE